MANALLSLVPSQRLNIAPGVRAVSSQSPTGVSYDLVDVRRGIRQALTERDYQIVNLLRSGLSPDDVSRRIGPEGVAALCQQLLAADLVIPQGGPARPSFLPDDRPKLLAGVTFRRTEKPGIVVCREPRSGHSIEMRDVDGLIARSCDGGHSVLELCEAAQRRGIPATVQTMASFLRELNAMGTLEGSEAPGTPAAKPPDADVEIPIIEEAPACASEDIDAAPAPPVASPAPATEGHPHGEVASLSSLGRRLEALQSLSLDKELDIRPERRGGPPPAWLPWATTAALAVAFFGYVVWGRVAPSERASGPAGPAVRIESVQPTVRTVQALVGAGYIAAREPITVGVTLSGRLKAVRVHNGQRVRRGLILAQLDDGQARAELALAAARKRDADRTLARMRRLSEVQGATAADVDRALGQVEIARAELNLIVQRIEQFRVRAPIDGTVLEVLGRPGEVLTVAANSTAGVIRMADLTRLMAEVDINESDIVNVRVAQTADALSELGRSYRGVVREIAQQADRARGTVQVKVDLKVTDDSLRPGNSVRVVFHAESDPKPRIYLARVAVHDGKAWVVGPRGTVSRREIVTQAAGPTLVEVTRGLSAGERVVVDPEVQLTEGQRVE